eukprot:9487311-Alexandrium_andersonii.AAC.1
MSKAPAPTPPSSATSSKDGSSAPSSKDGAPEPPQLTPGSRDALAKGDAMATDQKFDPAAWAQFQRSLVPSTGQRAGRTSK